MQGEARIALQVVRLARLPHRADPELAVTERGLDAGDARRAVAADRGERLVGVCVEPSAHLLGELRRGGLEFLPAGHAPKVADGARGVEQDVESDQEMSVMADRLRDLIDLVLASLDEQEANGSALARRAHFSRDHLDRILAGATGETPAALRRRLLLERAAWQIRDRRRPAVGGRDGGRLRLARRLLARVRARLRRAAELVLGADPARGAQRHPLPPAGGPADPGCREPVGRRDLTERLVSHHLDRVRELLEAAATLPAAELERPLRPGFVAVWFEGEEPSAAMMAERLVFTLEVWIAAMAGKPLPRTRADDLLSRFDRASRSFARLARAVRDAGAWDDAFVDALCEPPQSFTYGGVLAHILSYGAVRREMLASVLAELGARPPSSGDPIEWEQLRRSA